MLLAQHTHSPTRCVKGISIQKDNYPILPGLLEGSIIIANCGYWKIIYSYEQRCFGVAQKTSSPLLCAFLLSDETYLLPLLYKQRWISYSILLLI